nr:hypothetical protein Iba_chr01aCG17440 [Ipomoea batatas]
MQLAIFILGGNLIKSSITSNNKTPCILRGNKDTQGRLNMHGTLPLSDVSNANIVVYIVRFRTSVPASDVCFGSSNPLKTNGSTIKRHALELNRCLDVEFAEAAQAQDRVSKTEDGNMQQM